MRGLLRQSLRQLDVLHALLKSGEEHETPGPCSDLRQRRRVPNCRRSDARSDRARTSSTSHASRVSSRSGRDAPQSREVDPQVLQCPWLVLASTPTRDREVAL